MAIKEMDKLNKKPHLETRRSNRIKKISSNGAATKSVKASGISKSKLSCSSSKISNTKVKATLKNKSVTFTDSQKGIKKTSNKSIHSPSKSKPSKGEKNEPHSELKRASNRLKKISSDDTATKSIKASGISTSKLSCSSSKISNTKVKATLKNKSVIFTDSRKGIKKTLNKSIPSPSKSKSSKGEKNEPHTEPKRASNRLKKVSSDGMATKSVKVSGISKSKLSSSSSKISNTKVKGTLKNKDGTITDSPPSKFKFSEGDDKWRQFKLTEAFSKPLEKHSNKSNINEKKSKMAELSTSNFFKKYGMKMQSHEEIMAYRKQTELDKAALEELQKEMEDSLESDINFNIDDMVVNENVETLDCKHLTDDEVNEYFNKNEKYMYEIHNEIRSTTRSDKFKKGGNIHDLRYDTTSCTFTYEQKKLLYSLLHDKFGNENFMCTNDQYFFQVLIPELCLKIFMDVHDMTREEATYYLDNTSVKIRI